MYVSVHLDLCSVLCLIYGPFLPQIALIKKSHALILVYFGIKPNKSTNIKCALNELSL